MPGIAAISLAVIPCRWWSPKIWQSLAVACFRSRSPTAALSASHSVLSGALAIPRGGMLPEQIADRRLERQPFRFVRRRKIGRVRRELLHMTKVFLFAVVMSHAYGDNLHVTKCRSRMPRHELAQRFCFVRAES